MLVSAKSAGDKMNFAPHQQYSQQKILFLEAPSLAGAGFYSSKLLLFDSGDNWDDWDNWDYLNEHGKGLGTYVPVDELPWVAVLVGAMAWGMRVRRRSRN
jgi:hypothetical protein